MRIEFLTENSPGRVSAEAHVRKVYAQSYGAAVTILPPILVAAFNSKGETLCAAGIRTAKDGFFSDCYLDNGFSGALLQRTGLAVPDDQIMEVTSLASTSPFPVLPLLDSVIRWGRARHMVCGVFTATRPLRHLLTRTKLDYVPLYAADPRRLEDPQTWGRYYETDPWVCAVLETHGYNANLTPSRISTDARRAL